MDPHWDQLVDFGTRFHKIGKIFNKQISNKRNLKT